MNNFEIAPQTTRDSVPVEDFSFNFEEIKVNYSKKPKGWIPVLSL